MIRIHHTAVVSRLADIEDSQRGSLISIGAESRVDSFVKIKPAGGMGDVIIGERTYINSGCVIYTGNGIKIGDDVLIAANCTLAPVNHEYSHKAPTFARQGFKPSKGGIIIEDNVWIGANVVLLDGTYISTGVVIGAGSVVRGHLESDFLYSGNPIKKIKPRLG